MKAKINKDRLESIRKEIKQSQLILSTATVFRLSFGGLLINIKSKNDAYNQELQTSSTLITRLYSFIKDYSQEELRGYMDSIISELEEVDVISIVDKNNNRIYHTNHNLINTQYDGTHPDFSKHKNGFYTENSNGPSGPQRRTYSAIYDNGNYFGFIMTIRLQKSIKSETIRTVGLFLIVTIIVTILELTISRVMFKKIKHEFYAFAEDFEGTKFLVDSMRANNHDFTNKLHVILGLIQIGEYDKAVSYIENISIIQKETVSKVMNSIENTSLSALLIGKISRASECNVKFYMQENTHFKADDVDIPSEALVTITGNLIDNALDAMNTAEAFAKPVRELTLGVYTKPGELLIIVQDTGNGIPKDVKEKIFENGFSTKGTGRGVGLYHTKQLIESLGGTISVESEVGKGACFMVRL